MAGPENLVFASCARKLRHAALNGNYGAPASHAAATGCGHTRLHPVADPFATAPGGIVSAAVVAVKRVMVTVVDDAGSPLPPRTSPQTPARGGASAGAPAPSPSSSISFRCRAVIQARSDPPRECNVLVDFSASTRTGAGGRGGCVSVRAVRNGTPRKDTSFFLLSDCVHVSTHDHVRKTACLVAQFKKIDGDDGGRTKNVSLSLRGWEARAQDQVDRLRSALGDAASAAAVARPAPAAARPRPPASGHASRRARPPPAVDERLRASERRRVTSYPRSGAGAGGARLRETIAAGAPPVVKPIRQRTGVSKYAAMQAATDSVLSNRRGNSYSAVNAMTGGLIGRPKNADEPLRVTKSQRMQSRSQLSARGAASRNGIGENVGEKRKALAPLTEGLIGQSQKRPRPAPSTDPSAGEENDVAQNSQAHDTPPSRSQPSAQKAAREQLLQQRKVSRERERTPSITKGLPKSTRSRTPPSALEPESGKRNGGRGILNLGNTCYLGAALQALLGDGEFVDDIRALTRYSDHSLAPFGRSLVSMAGSLRAGNSSRLNPELVRSAISAHFKEFGTAAQQDVQEFIMRCFFVLERELGTIVTKCPVSRSFSLVLENRHSCTSCGYDFAPRRELFRDISIDIPNVLDNAPGDDDDNAAMLAALDKAEVDIAIAAGLGVVDKEAEEEVKGGASVRAQLGMESAPSLQDLVSDYFESQQLELNCDKETCDGKEVRKESAIVLAPRVLVLHVKRFRVECHDLHGFSLVKVSDPIRIPEILDLSAHFAPGALGPSAFDHASLPLKARAGPEPSQEQRVPRAARPRALSVPGRTRCNPPSPEAETLLDVNVTTVDEEKGAESDSDGLLDLTSNAHLIAESPSRGFRPPTQTQIVSPDDTQVLHAERPPTSSVAATPERRATAAISRAREKTPGLKPKRLFKVFGDADENDDHCASSSIEKSHSENVDLARRTEVVDAPTPDRQSAESEEAEEVQDFEATQGPVRGAAIDHVDESQVFELARRCSVQNGVARAALQRAGFNMTRAAGLLLDVGVEKQRVSNVVDLIDRMKSESAPASAPRNFRLSAIVRHCSTVAEYGHYVCDIRQADGSWTCFNDSSADPCGDRPYELETRMRDGYMFFYTAL